MVNTCKNSNFHQNVVATGQRDSWHIQQSCQLQLFAKGLKVMLFFSSILQSLLQSQELFELNHRLEGSIMSHLDVKN